MEIVKSVDQHGNKSPVGIDEPRRPLDKINDPEEHTNVDQENKVDRGERLTTS
jgi:hypothetical protein